jgi:hypothetical protein
MLLWQIAICQCAIWTLISKQNHGKAAWTLKISESSLITPHHHTLKTKGREHTSSEVRVLPPVFFCRCLRSSCNVKLTVMDNSKKHVVEKESTVDTKHSTMQWLWSLMPTGRHEGHKQYATRTERIGMYMVYWDIWSQQIINWQNSASGEKRTEYEL